jgi:hypothetical protein
MALKKYISRPVYDSRGEYLGCEQITVDMTPKEEAAFLADGARNDPQRPEVQARRQAEREQRYLAQHAGVILATAELTGKPEADVRATFIRNMPADFPAD